MKKQIPAKKVAKEIDFASKTISSSDRNRSGVKNKGRIEK
jgi:hypothetical protein